METVMEYVEQCVNASIGSEEKQKKARRDLAAWMPKFTDPRITATAVVYVSDCPQRSYFDELLLVNMFPAMNRHVENVNSNSFIGKCLTASFVGTSSEVFVCVQVDSIVYALPMKEILAGRWYKFNEGIEQLNAD
ncbi:hypothetical protein [Aeromonas sobria]|uniref:hypothetical protein n=1 Tax=Aeromonas sobria TaxID=646 RepID=UPI0012FF38DD|nr:hypothetical protein [Aeromonas sobria]